MEFACQQAKEVGEAGIVKGLEYEQGKYVVLSYEEVRPANV